MNETYLGGRVYPSPYPLPWTSTWGGGATGASAPTGLPWAFFVILGRLFFSIVYFENYKTKLQIKTFRFSLSLELQINIKSH